jgi:hypothetical protein
MSHVAQYEDEGAIKCKGAEDIAPMYVCESNHKTGDKEESCPHKQMKRRRGRSSYIDRRLYLTNTSGIGLH